MLSCGRPSKGSCAPCDKSTSGLRQLVNTADHAAVGILWSAAHGVGIFALLRPPQETAGLEICQSLLGSMREGHPTNDWAVGISGCSRLSISWLLARRRTSTRGRSLHQLLPLRCVSSVALHQNIYCQSLLKATSVSYIKNQLAFCLDINTGGLLLPADCSQAVPACRLCGRPPSIRMTCTVPRNTTVDMST